MIKDKIQTLKFTLLNLLSSVKDIQEIPTEDWGWENYRYQSNLFRLAHVEMYEDKNLIVLHSTIFPHHTDGSPIFGFDIIGNTKTDELMAGFLDLSPIIREVSIPYTSWEKPRELPEWGRKIFSKNMVSIEPQKNEIDKFFDMGIRLFNEQLLRLQSGENCCETKKLQELIIKFQNEYCEYQQQNKRTFGALKSKLGEEKTKYFMENILFPKI